MTFGVMLSLFVCLSAALVSVAKVMHCIMYPVLSSFFCGWILFFKPPPPVGAGGGYMFSGRPSVPLSVRACVLASVRPSDHP